MAKLSERVVKYEVPHNHLPADMKPSEVEENNSRYPLPEGYRWDLKDMSYYEYKMAAWSDKDLIELGYLTPHITKPEYIEELRTYTEEGENIMTNTLQEITATLIDNNPHLEDDQRIVFQQKGIVTSAGHSDIMMDLIATGEVMPALNKHNKEVRATTVREDILENTGREVMLKPIKKLSDSQLEWRFVATA